MDRARIITHPDHLGHRRKRGHVSQQARVRRRTFGAVVPTIDESKRCCGKLLAIGITYSGPRFPGSCEVPGREGRDRHRLRPQRHRCGPQTLLGHRRARLAVPQTQGKKEERPGLSSPEGPRGGWPAEALSSAVLVPNWAAPSHSRGVNLAKRRCRALAELLRSSATRHAAPAVGVTEALTAALADCCCRGFFAKRPSGAIRISGAVHGKISARIYVSRSETVSNAWWKLLEIQPTPVFQVRSLGHWCGSVVGRPDSRIGRLPPVAWLTRIADGKAAVVCVHVQLHGAQVGRRRS